MKLLLLLFAIEHLIFCIPIFILSNSIAKRNEFLDENFSPVDEEHQATLTAYSLSVVGPILFIVVPLIQFWSVRKVITSILNIVTFYLNCLISSIQTVVIISCILNCNSSFDEFTPPYIDDCLKKVRTQNPFRLIVLGKLNKHKNIFKFVKLFKANV
jgi:hypothetical protein